MCSLLASAVDHMCFKLALYLLSEFCFLMVSEQMIPHPA